MRIIRDLYNSFLFNSKRRQIKVGAGNYINRDTRLEGANRIGNNNAIKGAVGFGTYIGSGCRLDAKIGRFCSISNDVIVLSTNHPLEYVSTSPSFYSTKRQNGITYVSSNLYKEELETEEKYSVVIGNDVLISYGVYIMGGVTIGDGAVIGANSVVTHDVDPYAVVCGNPAKEIRHRFDKETIDKLLHIRWWDWPEEMIKEKAPLFCNPDAFIKSEEK